MNIYETSRLSILKVIKVTFLFFCLISCSTDNAERLISTDSAFKENVNEPQVVADKR